MRQPSFSIITPTINNCDLIGKCLNNVTERGHESGCQFEHLIIDGGSTDGTVDVISEYAKSHPHVVWLSGPDKGLANAANKALSLAKYEILGWLGADDTFTPEALKVAASYFQKYPDLNFLIGGHNKVRNNGIVHMQEDPIYTDKDDLIKFWKSWWKTIKLPWHATFYRRSVHNTLGPYDERFHTYEYEFYLRAAGKYAFMCVPKKLTNHRFDAGSRTYAMAPTKEWEKDMLVASREYWGYPLSVKFTKHLGSFTLYWLRKNSTLVFYRLLNAKNRDEDIA